MAGARVDANGGADRRPGRRRRPAASPTIASPPAASRASAQLRPCVPALSARSSTMLAPSGNLTSVPDGSAARQVQLAGQHQRGRLALVRQRARQRHAGGPAQRRQRRRRREHAAGAQARVGWQRDGLRQQRAGRIQQRAVGIVHGGRRRASAARQRRRRREHAAGAQARVGWQRDGLPSSAPAGYSSAPWASCTAAARMVPAGSVSGCARVPATGNTVPPRTASATTAVRN